MAYNPPKGHKTSWNFLQLLNVKFNLFCTAGSIHSFYFNITDRYSNLFMCTSFFLVFTFERHRSTSLEVHRCAAGRADFFHVVADLVAAVLPAAEAHSLVEGVFGVASEGHALLLDVQQRVDEQVDGALVGAFDKLVHICETESKERVRFLHVAQITSRKHGKLLPRVGLLLFF